MARYAEKTTVPVTQSRAEIERLLSQHKCSQFSTGVDHEQHRAIVQFKAYDRIVKFELALPNPTDKEFTRNRHGWARTAVGITDAVAQAERQKWRALLLVIKAKLEAVENKIASFEDEFLSQIVLPNQQTVGSYVAPMIEAAYKTGRMPSAGRQLNAPADVEVE
jgi:hypothetical protein